MSTTSTVPTVKARLVTVLTAALASASLEGDQVPVTYAWPGPDTQPEAVFLGPHPQAADIRLDLSDQTPTVKAGRKQRQESYTVRVTVWCWRPDVTATGAQTVETQAFSLAGLIEDVLAEDPRIGLAATVVQWIRVETMSSTLFPFERGWACELSMDLEVGARLT